MIKIVRNTMSAKVIGPLVTAVFAFASAQVAKADEACNVTGSAIPAGGSATWTMAVKQGTPCVGTLGKAYFKVNNRFKVTEKARHGFVGTSGLDAWVYKPAKGYVGSDRYVLSIFGDTMIIGPTVSTLTVNVSIHQ